MSKRKQEHSDIIEAVTTAMFELMGKKSVDEITILELINRAGVARGTFYNNFDTKDEVVINYTDEVISGFGKQIVVNSIEEFFTEKHIVEMFKYALNYEMHLVNMKRADLGELFLERLTNYLLSTRFNDSLENKLKLMALAGAEHSLMFHWYLENPKENRKILEKKFLEYGL